MLRKLVTLGVFAILMALPCIPALALSPLKACAESVENFSGCGCNSGNLTYTNDQASMFLDRIDDFHTRGYLFTDSSAWNCDFIEDQLAGKDFTYADTCNILLESGHGGLGSGQFYGYLCKYTGTAACNTCSYNTGQAYFGERSGQAYATPYAGSLRFLILCTCHSVDSVQAPTVWGPVFARGKNLMYVMGYTGTSADSWTTTEVGRDFVDKTIVSGWTMKQAWFWAIEDWWVNDTGALVTAGDTESEAINNRENMRLTWDPNVDYPYWIAWAWHEG